MLKNLRNRLFASYLLVLLIVLFLSASVTVTSLFQRPVPREFTWNRLELLLTGFTSQQFVRETLSNRASGGDFADLLDEFAESNNVRVMISVRTRNDTRIAYDSDDVYNALNAPEFEHQDRPQQRNGNNSNNSNDSAPQRIQLGYFTEDDNTEWLFAGLNLNIDRNNRVDNVTLLIAEPRSAETVQGAIDDLNDLLVRPFIRSALIGGVVAFVLAIFLTRNITRPLQALARSAQHVAKGEFSEEVPVTGPSEIQQVAIAFNRMTGEVRATQQSQREFMANVSHDLKTPLTSIQGYSQAIMDGATSDPTYAASIIHEEAERLNRMVQELTDLARLQAGRLSMKLTPLNVNEIVEAISERLAMVAQKDNISLTVETNPTPQISADGDRLVQVLTNLIGNAIKYTPTGGNILVQTGVRHGGVEIVVQDTGMGIPTEDLPHIFDRFYQVDKSRGPSRGTGLGLAITQEIVQSHGGNIQIYSDGVNQGTTVTVWLSSPNTSTVTTRRVTAE